MGDSGDFFALVGSDTQVLKGRWAVSSVIGNGGRGSITLTGRFTARAARAASSVVRISTSSRSLLPLTLSVRGLFLVREWQQERLPQTKSEDKRPPSRH